MNIIRLNTPAQEKSLGDYLAQFDRGTHADIIEQLARDDVDGAVCYVAEVEALDGTRATMKVSRVYGRSCTCITLDRALDMDAVIGGRCAIPRFYYRKDAEPAQAVACG